MDAAKAPTMASFVSVMAAENDARPKVAPMPLSRKVCAKRMAEERGANQKVAPNHLKAEDYVELMVEVNAAKHRAVRKVHKGVNFVLFMVDFVIVASVNVHGRIVAEDFAKCIARVECVQKKAARNLVRQAECAPCIFVHGENKKA